MKTAPLFACACMAALVGFQAGCATPSRQPAPRDLPALLDGGWSAPAESVRVLAGDRAAVLDGALAAANSLGYPVRRLDGARGRLTGTRRDTQTFDGARERTIEVVVAEIAPGSVEVRVVFRETLEDSAGRVSGGIVRDRAVYDVFFVRLGEALAGS